MPDREKVIEALEACVLKDPDDSRDCRHCPRCNYGAFITTSCINGVMADALALLKAQEPRVMTEQEMQDAEPGAMIYCEQRDEVRTYLTPLIKYDDGVFENRFLGAEPEAAQLPNVRFWTSRPDEKRRAETPWE